MNPAKIGKFDILPKQKVYAFRAQLKPLATGDAPEADDTAGSSASTTSETSNPSGESLASPASETSTPIGESPGSSSSEKPKTAASMLDLIQGGDSIEVPKIRTEPIKIFTGPDAKKHEFLEKCKEIEFTWEKEEEFFDQAELVRTLGSSSKLRVRLGFSEFHQGWMVFTCKNNGPKPSSIIGISLDELDDIVENIERMIEEIKDGLANKKPLYHPGNVRDYKMQNADSLDFWFDDSTYYSASGTFRARFVWQQVNVYSCYMNHVKKSSKHPNSFGPRIRFTWPEVVEFVEVVKKIRKEIPGGCLGM